jgi:hypothetical protein
MTIVDGHERHRHTDPGGPAAPGGSGGDTPVETEDIIRPGDVHVSDLENLCVGESQ